MRNSNEGQNADQAPPTIWNSDLWETTQDGGIFPRPPKRSMQTLSTVRTSLSSMQKPPVCGICADPHHDTTTHSCLNCTSQHGCIHKPPKCANCGGKHKANSPECEIMKAIRDPQSPQGGEVPMGDANTNANTTTGA